jgi:hypothetical protein
VGNKDALLPLGAHFEPVDQVKFKIVAAGWAFENEREDGEQRYQRNQNEGATVSHSVMISALNVRAYK